jgi:transposase
MSTITIGIDPHKASHTAVAVDEFEYVLDEIRIRSCPTQAVLLREWADGFRDDRVWAVESAQGLGYLLSQQLIAAGETVIDVPAVRASRVRTLSTGRSQKNDPNDARSVAIAALRATDLAEVLPDDHTRILRLLAKRHRDIGRAKNRECCRLHSLLLEMFPGGAEFKMSSMTRVNALLDTFTPVDSMGRQRLEIAHDLADGIDELTAHLKTSKRRITAAVRASGTSLTEICGLGPITAAIIIGRTGNIDRFPTRHRFASYNGTAPVEASSGAKVRHRLNSRGNRQLNWAIHVIAISQLRHDTIGRAFYDRKIEEGKTPKEAIRALKRRLSDVVYRHLVNDARQLRS